MVASDDSFPFKMFFLKIRDMLVSGSVPPKKWRSQLNSKIVFLVFDADLCNPGIFLDFL